jgi:hypothetical protein
VVERANENPYRFGKEHCERKPFSGGTRRSRPPVKEGAIVYTLSIGTLGYRLVAKRAF